MARKKVDDLIADLEKLLSVFRDKTNFAVGDIDEKKLDDTIKELRESNKALEDTKALMSRLVNEGDAGTAAGRQIQTRGLSGVRAAFGPDSSEYEQAGGTRASERKKPTPKKKT